MDMLVGQVHCFTLGLQIAQSRSYLYTLGPKVGIIQRRRAIGLEGFREILRDHARCHSPSGSEPAH